MHEFERLVSEVFRRQGYAVAVQGGAGSDGGVDVVLTRAGERVLVQCKHWRAYKVDVRIVRELLGVMTSERAQGGIVVTSGVFTSSAREFARINKALRLIDGDELATLIADVKSDAMKYGRSAFASSSSSPLSQPNPSSSSLASTAMTEASSAATAVGTPCCPNCGSTMVRRTARRGQNAGEDFWGCSRYPKCRGTRA